MQMVISSLSQSLYRPEKSCLKTLDPDQHIVVQTTWTCNKSTVARSACAWVLLVVCNEGTVRRRFLFSNNNSCNISIKVVKIICLAARRVVGFNLGIRLQIKAEASTFHVPRLQSTLQLWNPYQLPKVSSISSYLQALDKPPIKIVTAYS